jgi:hypothetical protein
MNLVKRGAHVTIVARDPKRLRAAEEELKVRPSPLSFQRNLRKELRKTRADHSIYTC